MELIALVFVSFSFDGQVNQLNVDLPAVTDKGEGIPKENIDRIFLPFFTTRKNGSGIGLSLSRQIVRMHGGTLQVSSDKDHGTKVEIVI